MEGETIGWYTSRAFIFTTKLNVFVHLAIVESVRDGTTLRVRLFMPDGEHQFVNISLAGARSPRAASKQGETSEPLGDDVSRYGSLANASGTLTLLSKPSRRNILPNPVYFNAPSKYNFFHYLL